MDSVSPREQLAAAFDKHADRDGMMGWLQFEDAVRELFAAPAAQQPDTALTKLSQAEYDGIVRDAMLWRKRLIDVHAQQPVADAPQPDRWAAWRPGVFTNRQSQVLAYAKAFPELLAERDRLAARVADGRADALLKRIADAKHGTTEYVEAWDAARAYLAQLPAHQNLTGDSNGA